jgi:hypothetical protein
LSRTRCASFLDGFLPRNLYERLYTGAAGDSFEERAEQRVKHSSSRYTGRIPTSIELQMRRINANEQTLRRFRLSVA